MNSASSLAVFPWQPACWLAVRGSDAATFLQGQFTNDLRGAASAVYGLWLNTKGKVLADSFVISQSDASYRVCSYHGPAVAIRERLESYVIADDVEIVDQTGAMAAVTLVGGDSAAAARALAATAEGVAFRGRRMADEHHEVVFPNTNAAVVREQIRGFTAIDATEMEQRRIAAKIPAVPRDVGPSDLPNEGGLEIDAISYTKGCYLGQEVMARLKNLGQVRRRLLRVTGPLTAVPSTPAPLFLGDRAVGELRSAVSVGGRLEGLALLTLMHVRPEARLALVASGDPVLTVEMP